MKTYLVLLGCALPLLWLAACTSADKCTRGEVGCKCTAEATCGTGARCVEGTCLSASQPRDDAGGDTGTEDAGKKPQEPIDCAKTSFQDACQQFCRALCKSEENLCVSSACEDPNYCNPDADLMADCTSACDADVGCLQDLCQSEMTRKCEDFGFEDKGVFVSGCFEDDPKCVLDVNFGCSDTCGTEDGVGGDLHANGICEDGGDGSVMPAKCPRSTDCTDCSSRVCGKQGDACDNAGDCCGFFNKTAYCVDVDRDPDVMDGRCLETCGSAADCDQGYTCTAIKNNSVFVCSP
jgi:hypothetical protein